MGRVRFRGKDWVKTTFWDRIIHPGLTKYVDPCQDHVLLGKVTVTIRGGPSCLLLLSEKILCFSFADVFGFHVLCVLCQSVSGQLHEELHHTD